MRGFLLWLYIICYCGDLENLFGLSELFYISLNSECNVQHEKHTLGFPFYFSNQRVTSSPTKTYTCMNTHANTCTHANLMHWNCYCLHKAPSLLFSLYLLSTQEEKSSLTCLCSHQQNISQIVIKYFRILGYIKTWIYFPHPPPPHNQLTSSWVLFISLVTKLGWQFLYV